MSNPDEKVVIVSSDTHIGPRLREDLRPYCPKKYLDDYDAFVTHVKESGGSHAVDVVMGTTGHFDAYRRLADLDHDGTAAEVIFHGSQNGQPVPFIISDPSIGMATMGRKYDVDYEHAAVGRHIYNEWLADFCSVEPARHIGLAHLPLWNIDDAIKEARWAREKGLRGINFPSESGPDQVSHSRWGGQFKYNDPVWEPFWSVCEELGMTLNTHGGAGDPDDLPGGGPSWVYEANELTRRPIHRMIFAGVFERHPGLKVVVTEQPGQWWQTKKDDLDSLAWMTNLPRKPSSYMETNVFLGAAFQSRFEALDSIEQGYWQNILWGTDYPHIEGTWHYLEDLDAEPYSQRSLRYSYHGLDPEKVKAMLGLNAIEVYGLDGDYLHDVAQKINAPTLAQIELPLEEIPADGGLWAFRTVGAFA
jgi:predicted TIM-barrel fold metal-dependent hydrolase